MKPDSWNSAILPVAALLVLLHVAVPGPAVVAGTIFAFLGLILIGIPHGSLDHIITEKTRDDGKQFSLVRFLGVYLLTMAVYALFWVQFPGFSLIVFLLLSAYHFGETDLLKARLKSAVAQRLAYMMYGILLLWGLLANDAEQTRTIIESMLPASALTTGFAEINARFPVLQYTEFLALGMRVLMVRSGSFDHIRLGVVLVAAVSIPLLEGFLLYFCHHHAWINLVRVRERLYNTDREGLRKMIKDMMPFSLISVFGIALLVGSSPLWLEHVNPVLLFFILISVLTLPHAGIMAKFYSKG